MELSDLHHPNCKINRKINSDISVGVGADSCRRESESSDSILLSPEASKATEAVEFIAEHLRNEDLYIQVSQISIYHINFLIFNLDKHGVIVSSLVNSPFKKSILIVLNHLGIN